MDGKEILTFDFGYDVQGSRQNGKYGLYSTAGYFLAFECICGEAYREFAEQKFEEFLSSVRFR